MPPEITYVLWDSTPGRHCAFLAPPWSPLVSPGLPWVYLAGQSLLAWCRTGDSISAWEHGSNPALRTAHYPAGQPGSSHGGVPRVTWFWPTFQWTAKRWQFHLSCYSILFHPLIHTAIQLFLQTTTTTTIHTTIYLLTHLLTYLLSPLSCLAPITTISSFLTSHHITIIHHSYPIHIHRV